MNPAIAPQRSAVLLNSACTDDASDTFDFHHFCVLTAAAPQVASFIQSGVPPAPTPIRTTINLNTTLSTGTAAFDGTVTITGANGPTTVPTTGGKATIPVPWDHYLVTVQNAGSTLSLGALPALGQDLTLEFVADSQAPTKACTPANPSSGSTSCTLTLASPLPVEGDLLDSVTGPAGATITNCGGETGGLACGQATGGGRPAPSALPVALRHVRPAPASR